jgi:hypothetical protein
VTFADLLAEVIAQLHRTGIPFMVTGSLASSFHGEPRATRDLDVVIDPTSAALTGLVRELMEAGFSVDEPAAHAALVDRTQFNAIGPEATKVDFIIRRERAFSIAEFERREPADLLGTPGYVATAEDLVIAKLEWAEATDSDRQRRDVLGIVTVAEDLDRDYIDRWAAALGLQDAWQSILDEASAGPRVS